MIPLLCQVQVLTILVLSKIINNPLLIANVKNDTHQYELRTPNILLLLKCKIAYLFTSVTDSSYQSKDGYESDSAESDKNSATAGTCAQNL